MEEKTEQIEQSQEEMLKQVKELQNQQKYFECLELMEKIITSTHLKYGPKSSQYIASQEKMCEICNQISMLFLTKDKKQLAFEFLKRSETLSKTSPQLQIITFNNFSCYYKKVELYTQAIDYLQKAITIGNCHQIYRNLADSYLNLCSIHSQQNKHKDALQNVLMAIYLLQNEMVNFLDSYDQNKENDEIASKKEIIYVLAVAYHNLGVELEYLKRYDEALAIYEKATKFAVENLGKNHELVSQLTEICVTAQQQIENQKNKQIQKQNNPKKNPQFNMTQQNLKVMQKQYQQQGGSQNKKQTKFNKTDSFKHSNLLQEKPKDNTVKSESQQQQNQSPEKVEKQLIETEQIQKEEEQQKEEEKQKQNKEIEEKEKQLIKTEQIQNQEQQQKEQENKKPKEEQKQKNQQIETNLVDEKPQQQEEQTNQIQEHQDEQQDGNKGNIANIVNEEQQESNPVIQEGNKEIDEIGTKIQD